MPRLLTRHGVPAGVLAMLGVLLAARWLLPDLGGSLAWSAMQAVLVGFLAAVAGGWLAGRRFLLPALGVWAALWLVACALLLRDAPGALAALAQANWLVLLLSGAAVAVGVPCGESLRIAPWAGTVDRA